MTVSSTHPDYDNNKLDWVMMRDSFKGERHVKEKRMDYLPALPSHIIDGMNLTDVGYKNYTSYLLRAVFPDFVQIGVETLVGILNAQEAEFKLPKKMEYLRVRATNRGESMQMLLRRLHTQQLITGRVGILADLPAAPNLNPQLYMALYHAETVINWDDGEIGEGANTLNMVVLNESNPKRNNLDWSAEQKFRVLRLNESGIYEFGVFEGTTAEFDESQMKTALYKGKQLKEIPFVFVNSKDNLVEPDVPPLLGLGRICFTIYRGEADYRHALFMQGQDTLVVVGGVLDNNALPGQAVRVGAGARIDTNIGGDAKYIGTNSEGIPEMRTALENDRMAAAVRTGQLLAPGKMSMESGEALKTRVAAQTATLTSVALSAAHAMENLLKSMARWLGENPEEVSVIPNLDFTNVQIQGQDIVQLITAKNLGFPLSAKNLHNIAKTRGLTNRTFEEEIAEIKTEPPELAATVKTMAEATAGPPPQGNNPTASAGGPKKSTASKGPTQGNKPKK